MNRRLRSILVAGVPLVVAAVALGAMVRQQSGPAPPVVLTGMVEATQVDVVPKIPGRLTAVAVHEGDRVAAGQVVGTLEGKEVEAKVAQAEGAVAAARAQLAKARNGARPQEREAARRLYEQARHQYELAEKTFTRIDRVFAEGVVSAQERDQARFRYDAAREQMEAAHAQYEMALEGARQEDVRAAEGLVAQAEGVLREAEAYRQETQLLSPVAGEVVARVAEPGAVVPAGYPVLTVLDPSDAWVVLQVREDQLGAFRMGAALAGDVPALGATAHPFAVRHVAAMADFATWRATNERGDFDLKTFEVHLRPVRPLDGLRPGMTVRVAVPQP